MLLNELGIIGESVFGELIKHDLKTNRGKRLKKIVKSASMKGNPTPHGSPFVSAHPEINSANDPGDKAQFSGLF